MTVDWTQQRRWEDVSEGQPLDPVEFPLSVYRLVMAAGATRDFNAIHHNTEFAQASGADEMYAATTTLLGMWERCAREFIGSHGRIVSITGFRMSSFNYVDDMVVVDGHVTKVYLDPTDDDDVGRVDIEVKTSNGRSVSIGPGTITVTMPRANSTSTTREEVSA